MVNAGSRRSSRTPHHFGVSPLSMRLFTENIAETIRNSASVNRRQRPSIYDQHKSPDQPSTPTQSWRTPFIRSISKNSSPTHSTTTNPLKVSSSSPSHYSPSFKHNPSLLTIPSSLPQKSSISRNNHANSASLRSESVPRKTSSSSSYRSTIDNHEHRHPPSARSSGRHTPLPGFRSASALSKASFRSLRSINSRIKVRIQSLAQAIEAKKPKPPEFDWSALRAEYELNLARGSIIERCLVQVDLGPTVTERGRWWIDSVWTLADKLSPPLPAALAQYSAAGLLPLLIPLRHTLHSLAIELPYNHMEDTPELERFELLRVILQRAIWLAGLIESVIEVVSQVGLVRFELYGLRRPMDEVKIDDDELRFDNHDDLAAHLSQSIRIISQWSGEIRGRTGSNNLWKGLIKLS
ncbi:uncharacterized protein VP01_2429g2 [Puccinia sorghi]|uniref:Uncharacterized protein n=1 Tax=Puccinia sorghi TaxID=27349 RepID=A0A0L6V8C2_9BASI|nr:uncharacterized protein VP01_2429g2 [Puccinia sorghi]